jgi:hypothetical protein
MTSSIKSDLSRIATRSTSTTAAALFAVLAACSASSTSGTKQDSGSTTPIGATATTNTGLTGCSPLEPGCYSFDGAYEAPKVARSCSAPGGPATGAADTHCNGVTPQRVVAASCGVTEAGTPGGEAGSADAGGDAGLPAPGECGENGPDYGATMYGTEGDDDDCKYHVTYEALPLCENDGTYFVVTAHYLTGSQAPLTKACTFAELCLNDTHVTPTTDFRPPTGQQTVVEGPPGTYTIGPVQFDQSGKWTVRFHFNEICCDVADSSPHGHAAFFLNVP